MTVPFQKGDAFEVEATRLNDDGDGVTSVMGVTTFIPGLLAGERASIEITAIEKRFARGKLVGVVGGADAGRVPPLCGVFGQCGGCQLQHLHYAQQLDHKRVMVEQTLRRLGKLTEVEVLPTLGMQDPWRYRNQVQVPLQFDVAEGRVKPGFFAAGSHDVVTTDVCHLEPVSMEATVQSVVEALNDVLGDKAGMVHHLVVRYSFTTGEQMVVLCVRDAGLPWRDIAQRVAALPHVVSVAYTVQPRSHGPIWGHEVQVVSGADHLVEEIAGLKFVISPRSFFQVNTLQARALYQKVLDYARVDAQTTALDAYCGTGTISLMLAKHAGRVVGIETIVPAVEDARRNAAENGVTNAEFYIGDVEQVLPKLVGAGAHFDMAVLDPPRKGCDPAVLEALLNVKPKRIVYVSCNHVTLARDLRVLVDGGYRVEEVQPVDMFPQTNHVECVVSTHYVGVAQ
jgi:23S rRNA (uracil1939-C5)-methyltransferase